MHLCSGVGDCDGTEEVLAVLMFIWRRRKRKFVHSRKIDRAALGKPYMPIWRKLLYSSNVQSFITATDKEGFSCPRHLSAEDCLGLVPGWVIKRFNMGSPMYFWSDQPASAEIPEFWQ
eukprot:12770665-Ditylum_brightwellii.AAC.1